MDDDNHSLTCTLHEFNVTRSQALASIIGYSLVGSIGVAGNTVVVCVFSGTRDNTLKFLILALSLADLTSCGLVLPLDLFRMYRKHFVPTKFHQDHIFADFVVCVRNTCFAVEGSVLFCVALDRYWCICRPTKRRLVSGPFIIVVLSVVGLCVMAMEGSVTMIHLFFDQECLLVIPMRQMLMYSFITLSFICMAVLGALYFRIFLAVRQQDRRNRARRPQSNEFSIGGSVNGASSQANSPHPNGDSTSGRFFAGKNTNRSRKTALMLFGSTLVYYATIMPIILAHLELIPEGPHHKLYYINNATNVIMYSLLNPNFRRQTRKYFSSLCPCITESRKP